MSNQNISLLLVEDDDVDTEAVVRRLRHHSLECEMDVAHDGHEALNKLRSHYSNNPDVECVVILDLNMPGMNGIQFLEELRANPQTEQTKVVVLTTSLRPRDRIEATRFGINGYFQKAELNQLLDALKAYATGSELALT